MSTVIGIDIGGSTTKIVAFKKGAMLPPLQVRAADPLTSLFGAFGKYISENGISLHSIDRVMITGVGSSYFKEDIYHLPTVKVDEFAAVGRGGLYLSGLSEAVIVSMGTGTAMVLARDGRITHLGGTGIGGGTLLGLSGLMLKVRDFDNIIELAKDGELSHIDLTIGDISREKVSGFTDDITAANFGKVSDLATKNDIALGIVNMVFQAIGMMAAFASRSVGVTDVVLTGNLTTVPQARDMFSVLQELTGLRFILPEHAEYATALGAAFTGSV